MFAVKEKIKYQHL